ncbi:MAG: beta-ketoacyl-[acyl-carrier-protein] synthase family protein [Planctomycetaceae bacterium]|nr:beta-ketoacyl-[acyl-carrier-protein] synthase family protein [Planctomycetaceae bacterium]
MAAADPANEIVITGVGMVSPLGLTLADSWSRLVAGERAGQWLPESPKLVAGKDGVSTRFAACPVPTLLPGDNHRSRLVTYAEQVALEAVTGAQGLDWFAPERRGCVIGTSKLELTPLDRDAATADLHHLQPSHPAQVIGARYACHSAQLCPIAACATGLHALLRGAMLLQVGTADVVLAGSVDASLHPAFLASYRRLGVMCRGTDAPAGACRPFDRSRSGFLVGEGGAMFVLERRRSAEARGVTPRAVLRGGGHGCDPTGMTQVDPSGRQLADFVRHVLHREQIDVESIQALALHGTATQLNDLAESRGLMEVFGERIHTMPAMATKGATGHLMGAAGAIETAFALQALQTHELPPVANLVEQEEGCRLLLPRCRQSAELRRIAKFSLGFGGHLAMLVLDSNLD